MTTLFELSGALRGSAILSAARECVDAGERVTPDTLKARLPDEKFPNFGDVGEDEAAAAFELIEQQAEAHAATLEAESSQAASPDTAPADHAEAAPMEAPTISPDEARENLRLASVALANARAAVIGATNRRNAARERLAACVTSWQTGLPRMTREQAVRESIASYQATREQQHRRPTPGPSVIDRFAMATRGGNYGAGGGNSFRRGASTVRNSLNRDPRRGPVAKLPSEM